MDHNSCSIAPRREDGTGRGVVWRTIKAGESQLWEGEEEEPARNKLNDLFGKCSAQPR